MFDRLAVGERLYVGFGLMLAIVVAVTAVAIARVDAINAALNANSTGHAAIQRFAINFRGSAHDCPIAIRDVVLSATPAERMREVAAIDEPARFYARSAEPPERLIAGSAQSDRLTALYGAIKAIESQAVATTRSIVEQVESGDVAGARGLLWTQAKPQ
jgi:methyl-accepting chemotaxis protein